MNETSNSSDGLRAALVLLATLGTIAFNGLAAAGYVNGVTPDVVSTLYPTVLTPAGYAFTIWSLIYVGMAAFSVYQLLPSKLASFRSIRTVYILTCLLNCAWIYFWHRNAIGICLALIVGLLASLILLLILTNRKTSVREALITKAPFGIYAGWVTAATLVNLLVFLKYADADFSAQTWNILGVASLAVAAVAAVAVRIMLRNFLYPMAVAWAAAAIAIKQAGNTAVIVAAVICVIVCLVLSISFVMDTKRAADE
jgi:translocator protein